MNLVTIRAIVLVLYLGFMLSVGFFQGKKVKSDDDYNIGGRSVPGWVAALSERATAESAFCMVGIPGAAYVTGMASIWMAIGFGLGNILAWVAISHRMQAESEKHEVNTYMDWISKRHTKFGKSLRLIGAFILVFTFLFYIEGQILGGGKTLGSMFGIKMSTGLLITFLIIMPYAVYGGFQSVVYTDVIQALLMIFTLIVTPIIGIFYIKNNPADVQFTSLGAALRSASLMSSTGGLKGLAAGVFIGNSLAWAITYFGGFPPSSIRYMSIKDKASMKTAKTIAIGWASLAYFGAITLGFIGIAIFGPNAFADPETVMPEVIMTIFPTVLGAILVTSAMAGLISTADSMLVLASSEISESIFKPYFVKGEMTREQNLKISRLITVALGLFALGLVYIIPQDLVYNVVGFAWGGLGASFSTLSLLTLFWKDFNAYGAMTAMVVGFVSSVLWYISPLEQIVPAMATGFIFSLISAVIATKLTVHKFDSASMEVNEKSN
ncbi:sodium/proline symporter [Dethiosulfatibacter aminovorans DSM 17477]|uniref:Sodium/proline symporter n=1 Tax=Dethiosulfatibacter aminovorans DSM 17477 TaxID=1121476 RepID=A0A1M6LY30_9FIRM|nr:sodium/proline symporter [Dethiosulfatibacter aminovorans]SHJ76076.1 sodium/proline symporter [Dethiosulfatibacter aminovorans DSM 17477]